MSVRRKAKLRWGVGLGLFASLGMATSLFGARSDLSEMDKMAASARLQPDNEAIQFQWGQYLLKRRDFGRAVTALEEAHRHLPQSAQIELALGVAYYCSVRYDDTVRAFLKTMALAPEVPQPYVFLGRMLEHADSQWREIARQCVLVERADPSNSNALLLHAKVLMAQRAPAEAAALLEKVVALSANSPDAYFTLGCLVADKGDYSRAAYLLKKSVQLNPKDPSAHYRLGLLYARLGDRAQADQEFAAQTALKAKGPSELPFE